MKGYHPGVVGRITELHATYYHEYWGFDVSFETQVGRELSEFVGRFQDGRDFFRVATVDGRFAGSIAIDGLCEPEKGVRLRWFIVHPRYHGRGIGALLLQEAVHFCRVSGCKRIYLWTFHGLDSARRLYERAGFHLSEERTAMQWGRKEIKEQMFEMVL